MTESLCCTAETVHIVNQLYVCMCVYTYIYLYFFSFFFFFSFLVPPLRHMEVPRLGVELELQLLAYTIATAMGDPGHICDIHHSPQRPNPLTHWVRPGIEPTSSWILLHYCWAMMGTPENSYYYCDCIILRMTQTSRFQEHWDMTRNKSLNPYIYGQLIFDQEVKNLQWGKSLFNKWCGENWKTICKEWY